MVKLSTTLFQYLVKVIDFSFGYRVTFSYTFECFMHHVKCVLDICGIAIELVYCSIISFHCWFTTPFVSFIVFHYASIAGIHQLQSQNLHNEPSMLSKTFTQCHQWTSFLYMSLILDVHAIYILICFTIKLNRGAFTNVVMDDIFLDIFVFNDTLC